MRRFDKKFHILKLNQRLNENRFSWDGNYANEENISEHHGGEYSTEFLSKTLNEFLDELKNKDENSYKIVEKIIEKYFNENEDVNKSQWFSDTDAERITDKELDS